MGGATAEGREHIRQGNLAAHRADVIADAEPPGGTSTGTYLMGRG
jgi:hypothetical protein